MREYAVVIERGERNYTAYVPDLPVILVSGSTVRQVMRRTEKAIALFKSELRRQGLPVPKPRTKIRSLVA